MDEATRVRRKDTTKGPPLRILSLDGGGVRGYSMLIILQELMHRTFVEMEGRAPKRHEIPKPCDHFDLIVGNGTGGLIAIMLGRLRLDLDTCKEVYVRMTRRVFETDKTIFGIPRGGTMFKASKLEDAIRDCVKEHTIFDDEGNDTLANATPMSSETPRSSRPPSGVPYRTMSQGSRYSQIGMSPISNRMSMSALRFGNPNALLYDTRENRTKTAVTAVFRGTSTSSLLRSYDSRKETAADLNCTVWQAGRATCATHMAFKPIQVGQSLYLDEGGGKYNPAPQVLDEAVQNEWPGREVGVFVSIGTGKRPASTGGRASHEWWEGFLGGSMGDFAEARRRMVHKLEIAEEDHQSMLRSHLAARDVKVENYYRLNVEVGVGEFGMNEWNRLAEISTSTRLYLTKNDVQAINCGAAAKMARIHNAKLRHERAEARKSAGTDGPQYNRSEWEQNPWERPLNTIPPPSNPIAVELQGDDGYQPGYQYDMHRPSIADQKYTVVPDQQLTHRPSVADQKYTLMVGDGYDSPNSPSRQQPHHGQHPSVSSYAPSPYHSPQLQPAQLRLDPQGGRNAYQDPSPRVSAEFSPPLPPKTPVPGGLPYPSDQPAPPPSAQSPYGPDGARTFMNMGELGRRLPYPDVQGPPPPVNNANKPTISQ